MKKANGFDKFAKEWTLVIAVFVLTAAMVSYCTAADSTGSPQADKAPSTGSTSSPQASSGQAGSTPTNTKPAVAAKADANKTPPEEAFEMPKEFIDRVMAGIKDRDPNKAKELEALRDKDPAKFREELGAMMRERMRERGFGPGAMGGGPDGARQGGPSDMSGGPGGPGPGGQGGPGRPGEQGPGFRDFQERVDEFVKWVKENYPDEAKKLEELKNDKDLYERQMRLLGRKYGWLYHQIQENPQLGAVLKEDMELVKERGDILKQINEAISDTDKARLTANLEKIVGERYDLIIKRTQIEYEQLGKRIEELKKQVEESRANVEKWKNEAYKKNEVKNQVKKLLEDGPKFRWQQ